MWLRAAELIELLLPCWVQWCQRAHSVPPCQEQTQLPDRLRDGEPPAQEIIKRERERERG